MAHGEIFGLLGPNGAGKTTTVECVQGLRTHDAGTVRVLGLDPHTDAAALRSQVGAQLQESALPARIRVAEALDLFSSLQPGGPDWRDVMRDWGLAGKARASFASLSGGQRQRLLVALAVVNAPRLVFLDEMTTGLDPAARRDTWDLIERIRDQRHDRRAGHALHGRGRASVRPAGRHPGGPGRQRRGRPPNWSPSTAARSPSRSAHPARSRRWMPSPGW